MVEVDTDVGRYRLPVDYLTLPDAYPELKGHTAADKLVARFQWLMFHFTMPDGTTNLLQETSHAGDDGGDRIGIDPSRFNVNITRTARVENGQLPKKERIIDPAAISIFSRNPSADDLRSGPPSNNDVTQIIYEGWTRSSSGQDRIGVSMWCLSEGHDFSHLCSFTVYDERLQIATYSLMAANYRHEIFNVARKISDLLRLWSIDK